MFIGENWYLETPGSVMWKQIVLASVSTLFSSMIERINWNVQDVVIACDDFQTAVLMNHVKHKKKTRNGGVSAVKRHFMCAIYFTKFTSPK